MKLNETIKQLFSFSPPSTQRYAWVDYAKGIAIIFVTYRHVIYGLLYAGADISPVLMDINEMMYGFRMPLFFFLSGLFFASSLRKRGPRNFFVNKFNTLFYPYMIWCLIQTSLQIIFSQYTNHKLGFLNYMDILIHPRSMLQQWYLLALFNVSVLYMFTTVVLKFNAFAQLLLGLGLMALKPYTGDISTLTDITLYYAFFALGHLSVAFFFEEKIQQQLASPMKILLLTPVFFGVQYFCMVHPELNIFYISVLTLLGGLLVIMISMVLANNSKLKFLQVIGHYSLYIYLLHLGIIFLLRRLLYEGHFNISVPALILIFMATGIYFSIVLYRLCMLLGMKFLFVGPLKERREPAAVNTLQT